MFTGPLFQIKLNLLNTLLLGGFQYPLRKAVPGKFHGSGGHSTKWNCLQDRANFHRPWVWQIVLILTLCIYPNPSWMLNWHRGNSITGDPRASEVTLKDLGRIDR